jgi:hypothetical protein
MKEMGWHEAGAPISRKPLLLTAAIGEIIALVMRLSTPEDPR